MHNSKLKCRSLLPLKLLLLVGFISIATALKADPILEKIDYKDNRFLVTTLPKDITVAEIEGMMLEQFEQERGQYGAALIKQFIKHSDIIISFRVNPCQLKAPALLLNGQVFDFNIYFNGEEIYSRIKDTTISSVHLHDFVVLPLPSNDTGLFTIHIHYNDLFKIGYLRIVDFGELPAISMKAIDMMAEQTKTTLFAMSLAGFFFIASLIILILAITYHKQHRGFLYFIFIFALGCGFDQIDTVFGTKLSVLLGIPPVIAMQYIILIPIGFWGILKRIVIKKRNWLFNTLIGLNILSGVALMVFTIQIFDFYNIFIIIQLLLAIVVIATLGQFRSQMFTYVSVGMLIYILFIANTVFPVVSVLEDYSSLGAIPLFLILCWLAAKQYNQSIQTVKDVSDKLESVQMQLVKLENRNILSQFEALRNQLNPHFLFNSLNVLSSLIKRDQEKSVEFVALFSDIYRYVLQSRNQTLVKLSKEVEFVWSFFALQQFRYGNNIRLELDGKLPDAFIPPLALQLLVENAIKHNEISKEFPLVISVTYIKESNELKVCNRIRKVASEAPSTGLGLDNLVKRYAIMEERPPCIEDKDGVFCVTLPLIDEP